MRYVHLTISALSLLFFLSHCKDANTTANLAESVEEPTLEAEQPILELLDPSRTGIDFANTIVETYENNITTNINMYNGGGLCIADINNDQLPDIYFVSSNGKNKMYLNQGNLQFKDITDESGLASEEGFETAVTAADVNADGFLDFYICRGGTLKDDSRRNRLFINNQNNTFSEKAAEFGIDDMSVSTGAKEKGLNAGMVIGGVIAMEALFAGPVCGASMNPVRSLAPALVSGHLEHLWV